MPSAIPALEEIPSINLFTDILKTIKILYQHAKKCYNNAISKHGFVY